MKFLLDTDTLIYFLKGHKNIVAQITEIPPINIVTSIINHAELLSGAYNSLQKKQNLVKIKLFLEKIEVVPFCKKSSIIFAEQKSLLKRKGNIIADLDLMIASIALSQNMTLVTNNVKHFNRIKKLEIINWY